MHFSTPRIEICSITRTPNAMWAQQIGRSLVDCIDGLIRNTQYLLLDRDTEFYALRGVLGNTETEVFLLPLQSPNLSAYVERFIRSMKSECFDQLIFFDEGSLRRALTDFAVHYHEERNYHGLGNYLIAPGSEIGRDSGTIQRRERLGRILRYYYREAA